MREIKEKFTVLGRFNQVLLFLALTFFILHFGRSFLIPVATGGLMAMLLVPVCRKMESRGVKRALAAGIAVLVTLIVIVGVIYVLINELIGLAGNMAVIGERLNAMLGKGYDWVSENFNVSETKQKEYLQNQVSEWSGEAGKVAGGVVFSIVSILGNLLIITVYTILMLIYRSRIKNFVLKLVNRYAGNEEVGHTNVIVDKITHVSSRYVGGIFLVVLILSIIYFIGLTIIGVENALFFSILAALINVIPYIGSVGGCIIVLVYTLITRDTLTVPIAVVIFFTVIQQLDSYVLTPRITGGQVQLGPLFTIMAILLGGAIWGAAGMILFIPLLGVCKVIFDNVDVLKPYGYLIGDK